MSVSTHLYVITLNINGQHAPIKRQKKKKKAIYMLPIKDTFQT